MITERLALTVVPGAGWRASDVRHVAREAEQAGFECRFTADRFWLYVHHSELGWAPAHEFVLGG